MKLGIIAEGETEYFCVPELASKLAHTITGRHHLHGVGGDYPWDEVCNKLVYPYVRAFALQSLAKRPDKVLIVVDREKRAECCGSLATLGEKILREKLAKENLNITLSIILPNPQFECWLLADTELLDKSPLFKRPLSRLIGDATDGKDILTIINGNLRPSRNWDKKRYGLAMAKKMDLSKAIVLRRSRSLRKFVKEMTN
ncbi:MAG: hypothetical protein ABSH11_00280 [Verrucomicrobiota bacterium]|jgi:hypothetical protein